MSDVIELFGEPTLSDANPQSVDLDRIVQQLETKISRQTLFALAPS